MVLLAFGPTSLWRWILRWTPYIDNKRRACIVREICPGDMPGRDAREIYMAMPMTMPMAMHIAKHI